MKKMMLVLVLSLLLSPLLSPVTVAHAEDGEVTYDGNAREFIFEPGSEYSPTDLFVNFKEVMPGDSISQTIHVRNQASNKVKVKIYLRALGAHEESEEFLSQLKLRVEKVDSDTAYMFDAAADETAQLTDWVCLGTLYSGGEVDLQVILEVPLELDNSYSSQVGYLDWEFKVEEFPIESSDPQQSEGDKPTGDTAPVMGLVALVLVSAAVIVFIVVWRRRREQAQE